MKLRYQLILAFLVLAVVPLAGATLYSYNSSIRAFRQAVEDEAERNTEEMGRRIETITADLSDRMQRLEGLPYGALPAPGADGDPEVRDAGDLYAVLRSSLGEAASLVRAIEFTPVAPAPPVPAVPGVAATSAFFPSPGTEPDGGRPRDPATPSQPKPLVLHLAGMRLANLAGWTVREDARLLRHGDDAVLVPAPLVDFDFDFENDSDSDADADSDTDEEQLAEMLRSLEGVDAEAIAAVVESVVRTVEIDVERITEQVERQVENARIQREEAARAREEARRQRAAARGAARAEMLQTLAKHKEKAKREARAPEFKLDRKLSCAVQRDGAPVATLEARLDTEEVLRTVLSRTETDAGEIAFAVGADGVVYTPDPEDQRVLDELDASSLGSDPEGHKKTRLRENWILVTRQVPALDLAFGIARPVGESFEEIRRTAGRNMLWGLGLVGIAMLGIVPLSGRMTRHLSALTDGASRLAAGDLDVRVPVRSRDEIGELARAFNHMGQSLRDNQRELVQQERLRRELEMCREIQRELLPEGLLRLPAAEIRAVSLPAREVGGDFFNYFPLPTGEIAVLMGDVSGKGVPAALMMANLQATLRARLPLEGDLAALAGCLDVEIEQNTPDETYVTLFMGVLDPVGRTLRYVNAGHNPQFVLRCEGGGVEKLPSTGRPLGLLSGGSFVEARTRLAPGDMLFLFTDGLVEAENERGEAFGERRLESQLVAARAAHPERFLERIEGSVREHRGACEVADDATMLVLRMEACVTA